MIIVLTNYLNACKIYIVIFFFGSEYVINSNPISKFNVTNSKRDVKRVRLS